jgi:Ca-activated chloride channel family protein
MNRHFVCYFLLYLCASLQLAAQPIGKLSKPIQRALNNYIVFGNEVVHACNIMHEDFITFNIQFNAYLSQEITTIAPIEAKPILYDHEVFATLPSQLYQNLLDDNIYLVTEKRAEALQFATQTLTLLQEADSLRRLLRVYVNKGQYQRDSLLSQGFVWLRRIEVLYYDLFELQEKTNWTVASMAAQYQRSNISDEYVGSIQKLQPAVVAARKICRTVRSGNYSGSLRRECQDLNAILDDLDKNQGIYLDKIPRIDNSIFSPEKQYNFFVRRGREFSAAALGILSDKSRLNLPRPPHYYYYNFNIFSLFNRYGDGLTAIFNKYINQSGEYYLYTIELPLVFGIIYPNIPAFDSLRAPNIMPDAEELAKIRAAQLDSLRRDSLQKDSISRLPPKIGDPTLKGFAANNLVLLLDVSLSMNEPDKLPLLKSALRNLINLMREEDNITIITYSGKAKIALPPTSAKEKTLILSTIDKLETATLSDADAGVQLAYQTNLANFIKGGNNRIIMATDGKFELSKRTRRTISKNARKNLNMSILYFSKTEYKDIKTDLQTICNLARGRYHYVQPESIDKLLLIEAQSLRK